MAKNYRQNEFHELKKKGGGGGGQRQFSSKREGPTTYSGEFVTNLMGRVAGDQVPPSIPPPEKSNFTGIGYKQPWMLRKY